MGDKLERIFEYRVLYAKQRELQIPLTRLEQERYGELRSQLPDQVPSLDERDVYTLLKNPLPAQFVAGGRFGSGTLRNGSALGLAISTTEEPPALGQRLILHVQEPAQAIEYTFPCRVVSRVVKGAPSMGVVFDGVPSQTRSLGRTSGVWHGSPVSNSTRPSRPPGGGSEAAHQHCVAPPLRAASRAPARAPSGPRFSAVPAQPRAPSTRMPARVAYPGPAPARGNTVHSYPPPPAADSRPPPQPARSYPPGPAAHSHVPPAPTYPPLEPYAAASIAPAHKYEAASIPPSYATTPPVQSYATAITQAPLRPSFRPEEPLTSSDFETRRRTSIDHTTQPNLERLEDDEPLFEEEDATRRVPRDF
jgi:hypothetical protein